jgi:CHAT domain-containing protein
MLSADGVFGVQLGFKKAGAHTLVMSLWSVNHAATQLMMTSFYEGILSGLPRQDAFMKAQAKVRATYPEPHFWAPFIMLDDI